MKKYYIIEFGGEKEINEMQALELENFDQAIIWILDSMESDEEYFDIDIYCDIKILKYEEYESKLDFYAKALVCTEYETIVTEEMMQSKIYSVEDIIKTNLSIISKITTKMIEE